MIRWLHISDLHIQNKADWTNFAKELLRKCEEIGKIDLVIVTGDFHDFGDGTDFEQSKSFLRKLMCKLNLDINQDLFIIPGNHDGVSEIADKRLHINAAKHTPLDICSNSLQALVNMFQDYETFVRELIPSYPELRPAGVHNRVWRDKINFIHCNTAIGADGKEKSNQLLDVDSLSGTNYFDQYPNIILAHNNFCDLHEDVQKSVRDVIRNNAVRAYLCGDRHMESVSMISYNDRQNQQIPCVGCYKSAPDARDHYSRFGIIVGEWQGDTAELKGWYWESGIGFKVDGEVTEQKIYMGSLSEASISDKESMRPVNEADRHVLSDRQNFARQMREFTMNYYNYSPDQIKRFNQKFGSRFGELAVGISKADLYCYISKAAELSALEEMLKFMKSL